MTRNDDDKQTNSIDSIDTETIAINGHEVERRPSVDGHWSLHCVICGAKRVGTDTTFFEEQRCPQTDGERARDELTGPLDEPRGAVDDTEAEA